MEERIENKRDSLIVKRSSEVSHWELWWKQMRPHTLTASFTPVLIGTALALPFDSIHLPVFFAMLLASLIIQAATNLFNEYYDFKRGLDTEKSVGIGGATVHYGGTVRRLHLYEQQLVGGGHRIRLYGGRLLLYRWTLSNRLYPVR